MPAADSRLTSPTLAVPLADGTSDTTIGTRLVGTTMMWLAGS